MGVILKAIYGVAALFLVTGVASAADGVLIVQRMSMGGTPQTNQVQIEKTRMRAEIADPSSGQKQVVIFDATKQVIDIVNVERKTYMELTKAQIDQLGGQMQQMMSQMESAMANVPPAQRAQMEAMMRGRGMGGGMGMAAAKTEYRKAGTDRAGKWACEKYEGYQNGQKVSELCTVEPSVLGLAAADIEVMQQLGQFFKSLVPQSAGMIEIGRPEDQGFSGIPVKTVSSVAGREVSTEITDVSRQTFADSLFQVPAGFQKQEFMGRGR